MCRLSSLRWVVIDVAPLFSAISAAFSTLGSTPPLAFLNVATWSIFTPITFLPAFFNFVVNF